MGGTGKTRIMLGIDEAGLGPMLGPLCVGFALVQGPEARLADLWGALKSAVSDDPRNKAKRVIVCDSKRLHHASVGIGPIEDSVLPCALAAGVFADQQCDLAKFFRTFAPLPKAALASHPWYREADLSIPVAVEADRLHFRTGLLRQALERADVQFLSLGSLPVVEGEFNRLMDEHQNKSEVNFSAFCAVMSRIWSKHPNLTVVCDRLGGRQFYAEALSKHLKTDQVEIIDESPELSIYHIKGPHGHMEIRIEVGADLKHFPAALASMAAKYTREICMEAFNRWFAGHQPGLKPTKGYVQDARRWLADTFLLRQRLGIANEHLIRVA